MARLTFASRRIGALFLVSSTLGALLSLAVTGRLRMGGVDSPTWAMLSTTHGLMMMAFTLMPALCGGLGLWRLPVQVGAEQLAFPRVGLASWVAHAVSLLLAAGAMLGGSVTLGLLALSLAGLSSLLIAINTLTTFLTQRQGMPLPEVPVFAWSLAMTAMLMLLAVPTIAAAALLLALRPPFDPEDLRQAAAALAHPLVFVLILPSLGIVTDIVERFARRPLAMKPAILLAMGVLAGLGVTLWMQDLYHPTEEGAFFGAAATAVLLPSLVILAAWVLTLARGVRHVGSPLLWAVGFMALTLGAAALTAGQDGVARFHYAAGVGAVFAAFGGFYLWLPQMTARRVPEGWAMLHAALMFAGANLSFLAPIFGWSGMVEVAGAALSFASFAGFLIVTTWAIRFGATTPAAWEAEAEPDALRA
ncbi:cbb3-type cytochrome c oxidase subunit I [Falsirhodobacter sp. 20TX0035]|uniref:cbb3-type cytochrome c oxidase subunit I n=1 Tax=Falsirhodobacter sp. 20TX0035 TaxID=3022019 RepID=UPI00232E49A9|nr:cbb3-type cytochrome c oxidase subunit I [Falsirhodobacter sp. 20TX0035]MDB6454865.1 cbb3-type cytochrome c oxidase subunit I [Falsirhodobacter sp. 20TX0035]